MSQKYFEETKVEFRSTIPEEPTPEDLENQEYEQISYEGSDDQSQSGQGAWGFTQKELIIPYLLNGFRPELEAKAKDLNLTFYFHETGNKKVILMGEGHDLESFSDYMDSLVKLMEEKNLMSKLSLGESTQKEIPLTPSFKHFKPLIEKAAETLELVIEHGQTKLTVYGYERRIKELMAFLFEKESEYGQGQLIDQEINISTFHRKYMNEIEGMAHSLGLKSDFGYDMIYVRGPRKPVDKLILYLMSLETQAKKALFPEYWDFKDNNPLSLILVALGSPEYQLVSGLFTSTLGNNNVRINSIQRIQNKYLMDQFITVINKKMEERPTEPLNRMLLFHGTKQNPPEKIYGNFDTGFDLQYAHYGSYGKGLYFAKNSSYSNNGYTFVTPQGTRQMFLADVFVGKSYNGSMSSKVKAPEGYDSACASDQFYIVYHNFYSYPLYLIDYS